MMCDHQSGAVQLVAPAIRRLKLFSIRFFDSVDGVRGFSIFYSVFVILF